MSRWPLVTMVLAAAMLVASVSTMLDPALERVIGGIDELRYPWQGFTSAFVHGWPGFPAVLHLGLNLALLSVLGPVTERMLGSMRLVALTLLAIGAYLAARAITGIEANGSSVFLWAYAPILFVALRGRRPDLDREKTKGLLVVMWGIVPVAMVAVLVAGGIGLGTALAFGNLYHATATLAGFAGALVWKERIARSALTSA